MHKRYLVARAEVTFVYQPLAGYHCFRGFKLSVWTPKDKKSFVFSNTGPPQWPVPTERVPHRCSDGPLSDAPMLQTSNCSLPFPFLLRWTWTERDGCSFGLFEWLHDLHLFVQTNPNPYPIPDLNQFMPNPNHNLTSVHTLPLNLVLHSCSAGPLEHWAGCILQHAGGTVSRQNNLGRWNNERTSERVPTTVWYKNASTGIIKWCQIKMDKASPPSPSIQKCGQNGW